MSYPLEGVRILDFTRMLPGPYCTSLLADMGADVIKVEDSNRADPMRMLPPYLPSGMGVAYLNLNKNKRAIAIDLKAEGAREIILKLAEWAEVLVEQYRPGVMDKIGLGYDTAREVNDKIIYCSITGYGQYGPYRDMAGHDINFMAFSGMQSAIRQPGEPPRVCPLQISDLAAGGMMGAVSILAAYIETQRTGRGHHVDVSMLDGTVSMLAINLAELNGLTDAGIDAEAILNGMSPWYTIYATADGHMAVGTIEFKFWHRLCELLDRPEYINEQYNISKFEEMTGSLGAVFAGKTTAQWVEFFRDEDVCVSPVNGIGGLAADPQVTARGMISTIDYDKIGKATVIGTPYETEEKVRAGARPAPVFGEHTEEVLSELGLSPEKVGELESSGVVQQAGPEPGTGYQAADSRKEEDR